MIESSLANWIWIVFVIGMIVMHRHGGCGSHTHGHHARCESHADKDLAPRVPRRRCPNRPATSAPVGGARGRTSIHYRLPQGVVVIIRSTAAATTSDLPRGPMPTAP